MSRRDTAEVEKLYQEALGLMRNGVSVKDACANVGINPTIYYARKGLRDKEARKATKASYYQRKKGASNKPTLNAIEMTANLPARLIAFVGQPVDVLAAVRAL